VRDRRLAGRRPRAAFARVERVFDGRFVERAVRRAGRSEERRVGEDDRGGRRRARRSLGGVGFVVQFGRQRGRLLANHEDRVAGAFGFFVVLVAGVDRLPGEFARGFERFGVRLRYGAGARERVRDRRLAGRRPRAAFARVERVFDGRFVERAVRRAGQFRGVKIGRAACRGRARGWGGVGVFGFVVPLWLRGHELVTTP